MSDSGPNLGVRGVGCLLFLVGLLLISTGYRIRRGKSKIPVPRAMAICAVGAFTLAGADAIALGATLVGVSI